MALDPSGRPTSDISKATQSALGLPPGFQRASPFPFGGMNQTDDRSAIGDQEFYWLENLLKIGNGKLRALGDVGPALYRAPSPRRIVCFFWFNIGSTDYCAVFLDNGAAYQVRRSDGATTTISSVNNTFYTTSTGQLPACCGSGGQYLLITNNNTANDYWIWDGTTLYRAGSIGPTVTITDAGSSYTSAPTVTAFGGSGSGITATATVTNGSVTAVNITNPGGGYQPSDVVQFLFTGGGSDNGAELTATITAGGISAVILTDPGTGYGSAPTVGFTGGGGSGATATATISGGVVTAITITDPGSGYTGTPTVTFTGGSPTTPASGYAQITAGVVTGVTVVSGGSGFASTPLLTITGGGGSGATATATVTAGSITSVTVTAGGSGYTGTPGVFISGGANRSAQAQAELMPYGISGTYIETFQSRVWIPHPHQGGTKETGGIFNVSAPGSLIDFATNDGGLEFTSTDRYLRSRYSFLRQANGYLYPVGDSSASVISNVQTSGNPPNTTFTYQNADPQIGTAYQNSVADFGRTILFSNQNGVYGIFGGAVVKVSAKMDRIFQDGVFPGNAAGTSCVTPSGATVILYDTKAYVLLQTITDPFTGSPRTVMLLWTEKDWFIASSSKSLTFIGGLETESNLFAYGTDGTSLYPLFTTASDTLLKVAASKMWGTERMEIIKEALAWWVAGTDLSDAQAGIQFYWSTDFYGAQQEPPYSGQGTVLSPNNASGPITVSGSGVGFSVKGGQTNSVTAPLLGFKVTTMSPDFEINNMALGYIMVGSIFA